MLVIDGCDEAILGYVDQGGDGVTVVYSYDKLVDVFRAQFHDACLAHGVEDATGDDHQRADELAYQQAVEWVGNSIAMAHTGAGTPLILYSADRALIDELAEGDDDDSST